MSSEMPASKATAREIRAWASANGIVVKARGRLAQSVKDAFLAATGRIA